jgi:1-acyl-sn-glycerol-3-phosphate acyltransferase
VTRYYSAVRSLASTAFGLISGWEVKGRENVPRQDGLIVACNHISFWDPPMVGAACPRELSFLAKEELFATPLLGPVIRSLNSIPIRRGVADLSGMSRAIERIGRGGALLMFPEGSRMRDGELHPARPGVGMMAVHADVPIVPCFISGSNRPGKWWRRGARPRLWFGRARPWRELSGEEGDLTPGRALYQRVADAVMREIAALKSGQMAAVSRAAAGDRRSQSS